MLTYKYIKKPDFPHSDSEVIESNYTPADIEKVFTVFNNVKKRYHVFRDNAKFFAYLYSLDVSERTFQEVVFDVKQKIKFDIDIPADKRDQCEDFDALLDEIENAIRLVFYILYEIENVEITRCLSYSNSVDSADSSAQSTRNEKLSAHLIVQGYCTTAACCNYFTTQVVKLVPDSFIDVSVNKRLQNFRIVDCHKGDMRIKHADCAPEDTLLTNIIDCIELPEVGNAVKRKIDDTNDYDLENVLRIATPYVRDHVFNKKCGTLFIYKRTVPGYCEQCLRTHDNDNTTLISIDKDQKKPTIPIFKLCRRFKAEKNGSAIWIGEYENPQYDGTGIEVVLTKRQIASACEPSNIPDLTPNVQFNSCEYCEPKLRPFELCKTLIVHAMMKMGKTITLSDYITTHYKPDGIVKPVIRFISFRQTFSGNVKEKFPDFTLYSDVKGALTQDRLIVQVESLHRLQLSSEQPDLLILDECESIFEQFDSGLLKNFSDCFAKFMYLMRYSKHVVLMDAAISDRTINITRQLRGLDDCVYHHNTYQNARDDNYYFTSDKKKWLTALYSCIRSDEKIAIQINTLEEAKVIEESLKREFPDLIIRLYSSETSMSEKREHFANVGVYWTECDVLMYTPTVSAGVSYEIKRFHRCFGYFTDKSCGAETCMQMIGRIRDVSMHSFIIYLQTSFSPYKYPVDTAEIKTNLLKSRENLLTTYDNTGLVPAYNERGEFTPYTTPYFDIWCENTRMRNLSRNNFIGRLSFLIRQTGASIYDDSTFDETFGEVEDTAEYESVRRDIKDAQCDEIANARDIDDNEFEDIVDRMRQQQSIPRDVLNAMRKYKLRHDYSYGDAITPQFVARYNNPKVRRQYRNWNRILRDPDPMVSIEIIRREELATYKYAIANNNDRDMSRKYVYDQHRYAIGLLRLCGWNNITESTCKHVSTLADKLRESHNMYWKVIYDACREFSMKPPYLAKALACRHSDADYVATMLAPINVILSQMYGVHIAKSAGDEVYQIKQSGLFSRNVNSKLPYVSAKIVDKFDDAV